MQTTLPDTTAPDALPSDVDHPLRVAEFHALLPPYGDPQTARVLAKSLRELVEAAPHGQVVDCAEPDPQGGPLTLGLNLWPSPETLRDYVHRSGSLLRRWRLESGRGIPTPQRVLWWTTGIPDLTEARLRLKALTRHGPGPGAFTLRSPHPAPHRTDRARGLAHSH
jgi:hypothetical protein